MPIFTRIQQHKHESKDLAHRCDETQTPIHYLRHRTDYYSSVADNIADAMPLLAGGYIEAITSCARLTTPSRNVTVAAQDTGMVISLLHQEERRGITRGQVASVQVEAPEALQIHHVRVVDKEIYLHKPDTCQNFGIK